MKYCSNCGAPLAGSAASFCSECGKSVPKRTESAPLTKQKGDPALVPKNTQGKKAPPAPRKLAVEKTPQKKGKETPKSKKTNLFHFPETIKKNPPPRPQKQSSPPKENGIKKTERRETPVPDPEPLLTQKTIQEIEPELENIRVVTPEEIIESGFQSTDEPAADKEGVPEDDVSADHQDEGYDGYYNDILPEDGGYIKERLEPELIKRIIFVIVGMFAIVFISVLVMKLL